MDQTLLIFSCVALAAVTTLCVTIAIVAVRAAGDLKSLTMNVVAIKSDVSDVKRSLIPVIDKAGRVMDDTHNAMHQVNKGLEALNSGTELFKSVASDIKELEKELVDRVRTPLMDVASLVAGTIKGATAFITALTTRRK